MKENGNVDASAIAVLNRQITQYHHDDATRSAILAAAGIDDDGSMVDAPCLNNLEDWTDFHKEVIAGA